MDLSQIIHLSIDRHLHWFHPLAIVNNAALHYKFLCHVFLFLLDIYLGVEILGQVVPL